jgi:HAD superfamily hydrolase (TIGR01549 family)
VISALDFGLPEEPAIEKKNEPSRMRRRYQAVFFDFDGVILDSVHVKTRTFAAMFRHHGSDIEEAVVRYHLANGGVSRFEKFRYFYEQLLSQSISDLELKELGEEFSRLALQDVLNSAYIPGALDTLKQLNEMAIPCFVASGTPDQEIKQIVKKKDLAPYFLEVHGSPKKKESIVLDVTKRHCLVPEQCLFIGDAMTDFDAAKQTGTDFLGISPTANASPFPDGISVKNRVELFENP